MRDTIETYIYTFEFYTECVFAFFLLRNFITTFTPEGQNKRQMKIKAIVLRYIKGYFLLDAVTLVPVTILYVNKAEYIKYFYLIKSLRILKALEAMKPTSLMKYILKFFAWKLDRKIRKDPSLVNDTKRDHM